MATFKSEHFGPATAERLAEGDSGFVADRNIYLNAEGKVVEENDPTQARQLVGKGGTLSPADVEKYGLGKKKKAVEAEAPAEEVDGGEKASSPSANKAASPASNKAAKSKGAKKK